MNTKSSKPSKQRLALHELPYHLVSRLFTVPLDDALQEEYGIKRISVRKDDYVRVISGEFEGIEGKVLSLNKNNRKITIEECALQKKDGKNYYVPISVSRVVLTKFTMKKNKMDPWREKIIERKEKLEEVTASKKKGGK
jgi:large subunit ribosomal protein L24